MTSHTHRSNEPARATRIVGRAALAVVASSLLALSSSPASAGTPSEASDAPSVSVSYGDLNLATEEGTLALYKRIVSAARQVCPADAGPNVRLLAIARRCVDEAVARAVSDIRSPRLAELQAARARPANRS